MHYCAAEGAAFEAEGLNHSLKLSQVSTPQAGWKQMHSAWSTGHNSMFLYP